MNLYAWSREGYIVGESGYDEEALIILYTLSETPNVGDLLYKSDGTPAEQGELKYNDGTNEEVNLNNTVYRVGNGYIDVYGISETGYTELAPDFSRDSQNDLEVETEKPLAKLTIQGKTYYVKDAQAREDILNKQDTLVSGTNIKTVNGNSLVGSGNVAVTTYTTFNPNWNNSSSYTTLQFCNSVNADTNAVVGMAYLGSLKCSDIPIPEIGGTKQGDATVKIIGQGQTSKIITIELSSSSTSPYKWEYSYHSGHTDVGWIGFQPELPSQSEQSGKFLTTDGTNLSWAEVQQNEINKVNNSGSVLPTPDIANEKFLNTTDEKIYTSFINSYSLKSSVTNNSNFDTSTGVASGFRKSGNYVYGISNNEVIGWTGSNKVYRVHFLLNSIPSGTSAYALYKECPISNNMQYNMELTIKSAKINLRLSTYVTSSTTLLDVVLCDTSLQSNQEYYLELIKNGNTATATLSTVGYGIDVLETNTINVIDNYPSGEISSQYVSYGISMKSGNTYYGSINTLTMGQIYLGDSSGNFVDYGLNWNNGTALVNNNQYLDITNNLLYYYKDNELLQVGNELPSQTGNNGKFLTTDGTNLSWGTPQGGGSSYYKALNVVVQSSDWVLDNTISGYNYKCEIPSIGVTNQMVPQVYFSDTDVQSDNYSSICETDTDKIIIYSKVNVGITIPSILAF